MKSSPGSFRVVRKVLADGSVKEYRYPPRKGPVAKTGRWIPNSIGALLAAYRMSPEYRALAPATHDSYKRPIEIWQRLSDNPVSSITRRQILTIRDALAAKKGNGSANVFIRVTSTILTWALERDWIVSSPAMRIKALPTGSFPAWSEEQVAIALKGLPEHLRRAMVLGLHTGQRRGDLVAMEWTAIQGSAIRVIQKKTGANLLIPITPALATELAAWRADSKSKRTILETGRGKPWIPVYLSREMARKVLSLGLPAGLNIHGLRKLAATRLANAGCSTHEIAAITGHKTLGMIAHYTASADQERMAKAAVSRLKTVSAN
jgi:integrase